LLLNPDKLSDVPPAEVLNAAARGHIGLDHRFLHALLDRSEESMPAVLEFGKRDRSHDAVDLAPDLIAIHRHWKRPDSLDFLINYIKEAPTDVPDEAIEAVVELGQAALEPLLTLYGELDETESGEIAFMLANLGVRDPRVLELLLERMEYDLSDTLLLLGVYGDPQARGPLEITGADLPASEGQLKQEIRETLETLDAAAAVGAKPERESEPFDIWSQYPERAELPIELLDEEERLNLLATSPSPDVRAAAASSFFNRELSDEQRTKLLSTATSDDAPDVRARAWEALMNSTEDANVAAAMLEALRNPETTLEERGGLLVGLAPEADRNEVRQAIEQLYSNPSGRAKALEAMWRSIHPSFRDYFPKHLDDSDVEIQRGAIWGVGYYGLKAELERLRKLFDHPDLRSDAIFAYALASPGELSRGRMKGILARIEKDAHGLSDIEEDLVKAALDERLMLAGKEPFFSAEFD
jgi:hypothetical protein